MLNFEDLQIGLLIGTLAGQGSNFCGRYSGSRFLFVDTCVCCHSTE